MATLLAHIRIKPGQAPIWEATMRELVANTRAHEPDMLRYEYWRAQEPLCYYGLLSFKDKAAFFAHQDADYHRSPAYGDMIDAIRLEFVDPVPDAAPLPPTANPALPADAPDNITEWETQSPVQLAAWWAAL